MIKKLYRHYLCCLSVLLDDAVDGSRREGYRLCRSWQSLCICDLSALRQNWINLWWLFLSMSSGVEVLEMVDYLCSLKLRHHIQQFQNDVKDNGSHAWCYLRIHYPVVSDEELHVMALASTQHLPTSNWLSQDVYDKPTRWMICSCHPTLDYVGGFRSSWRRNLTTIHSKVQRGLDGRKRNPKKVLFTVSLGRVVSKTLVK